MSVVTITLLHKAKRLLASDYCISIDIRRELNRIPKAKLVLLDGDAAERKFKLSDSNDFEPGKEIEVKLRYESQTTDETVFKGLVMRHSIEADCNGSLLTVDLKDVAVALTRSRKSEVYVDQTDDQIVRHIVTAAKVPGLSPVEITKTIPKHAHIVQHYCTDWDFIVSRAEAQGRLVVVEDGTLSVRQAKLSAQAEHSFEYGIDEIYDLEFSLDAEAQYPDVDSSTWDVKQQKIAAPVKAKPFDLEQGNLRGDALAQAIGIQPSRLSNFGALASEELQPWADGQLMRSRLSMFRGRLSVNGFAKIKLLDSLKIDGIGERFNGNTLVTGICHRVDHDGWRVDLQFGLSARSFALEENIQDAPAAGLLPGINGLHIGVVDKFEADKDKQFRVKVELPGIAAMSESKQGSLWARLAVPDAGKERGWFFYPEPGDEVVIGFFNDDPRQAVILGSLFSSKNTPPKALSTLNEKNEAKAIVSKTGSTIGFIDKDEKGKIFIETKAGANIQIDDQKKILNIFDQSGNSVKMSEDGITLDTKKALTLKASGNVTIEGKNVTVKGGKVDIK